MSFVLYLRNTSSAGSIPYFAFPKTAEKVLRKPTWALSAPIASTEAAKLVPTSILKFRPVICVKQSAMAVPALVILPVSPEGTKVITIGLSAEPSSPAFTVGALGSLSHLGAGGGVGACVAEAAAGCVA